MRSSAILLLAAIAAAYGQIAKSLPANAEVVTRPIKGKPIAISTFTALERRFDARFFEIGNPDNPIDLLGNTRGIHVEGFGVVFTTELGLLRTPQPTPFMTTIPKEWMAKIHQQKLERLPALRKAMRDLIQTAGLTLTQLSESDQIVVAVRLDYSKWENTSGLPGQIILRADRKSAMIGQITSTEEQ
jgi:hypothetical protein